MRRAEYAISARRITGGTEAGTIEDRRNGVHVARTPVGTCLVSDEVAECLTTYEPSIWAEAMQAAEEGILPVPIDFEVRERPDVPQRCWPYRKRRPEYIADVLYEAGDAASTPHAKYLRIPTQERLSRAAEE